MVSFVAACLTYLGSFFRSRSSLALEILVLRHQLSVFERKQPRPHIRDRPRILFRQKLAAAALNHKIEILLQILKILLVLHRLRRRAVSDEIRSCGSIAIEMFALGRLW